MAERLEQPSEWLCLVAESNGMIFGHLWIQIFDRVTNPAFEPERCAYNTSFYVIEESRGAGVGSMLLSAALERWEIEETYSIILRATDESRPLYLRSGFGANDNLLERVL